MTTLPNGKTLAEVLAIAIRLLASARAEIERLDVEMDAWCKSELRGDEELAERDRQIAALRKAMEPFAAPGKPPHNILASAEQLEAYRVLGETATDAPKEGT